MELPCKSCHAVCCGPVPLSAKRLEIIEAFLREKPEEERERLAGQKRGGLTCQFVDMRDHTCSVYKARPT